MAEISEKALLMHAENVPAVGNEANATVSQAQSRQRKAKRFKMEEEISSPKVLEP